MRKYLDDGCKWCWSQEWNEDGTDVEHGSDCPAPLLLKLAKWHTDKAGTIEEVHQLCVQALALI